MKNILIILLPLFKKPKVKNLRLKNLSYSSINQKLPKQEQTSPTIISKTTESSAKTNGLIFAIDNNLYCEYRDIISRGVLLTTGQFPFITFIKFK